jgi:hypothetical protein
MKGVPTIVARRTTLAKRKDRRMSRKGGIQDIFSTNLLGRVGVIVFDWSLARICLGHVKFCMFNSHRPKPDGIR